MLTKVRLGVNVAAVHVDIHGTQVAVAVKAPRCHRQ